MRKMMRVVVSAVGVTAVVGWCSVGGGSQRGGSWRRCGGVAAAGQRWWWYALWLSRDAGGDVAVTVAWWCGGHGGKEDEMVRRVAWWLVELAAAGVAVEDVCSGVVTVVAKVAAGWWRPRWCGDCEGSGGERVTKMRCDVGWGGQLRNHRWPAFGWPERWK
ncbi:hypothetical protein Tco_1121317 [Tanacetum coccineum]|uniref:Uncharacterized protein n=1 Tax=Tanacetum coccineum TaxID=301880 RepID=A0ABQ5IXC5_9ASTR